MTAEDFFFKLSVSKTAFLSRIVLEEIAHYEKTGSHIPSQTL